MRKRVIAFLLALCMVTVLLPAAAEEDAANAVDEAESNDTIVTANLIPLNTEIKGSIRTKNDVDWFAFTLPSDGMVQLSLRHEYVDSSRICWETLFYTNANNGFSSLYWAGNAMDTGYGTKVGLPAGTYYLKINGRLYSDYIGKTYWFSINYTASDFWEKEQNNTPVTATPVTLDTEYHGSLYDTKDADWYSFTVSEDCKVQVSFDHGYVDSTSAFWRTCFYTDANHTVNGSLFRWIGNAMSAGKTEKIALDAGTYYLKIDVDNVYRHTNGAYSFSIITAGDSGVKSISLDRSVLGLKVGEAFTLPARVEPASSVITWSSSDTSVATVSSGGKVTAVGAGAAVITAASGGKTASCSVTVSAVPVSQPETPAPAPEQDPTPSQNTTPTPAPERDPTPSQNTTPTPAPSTPTTDLPSVSIPPNVFAPVDALKLGQYNGHSYYVFRGEKVGASGWPEAKAYCESLGGHLVTITSEEENTYLVDYFFNSGFIWGNYALFGLFLDKEDGNWHWVTGEPLSFLKWGRGAPGVGVYGGFSPYESEWGGWPPPDYLCAYICEWDYLIKVAHNVHMEHSKVYSQGQFKDVPANQWYTSNVADAVELELMNGVGGSRFDPFGNVSIAQAIAMAARIRSKYIDDGRLIGGSEPWYQRYLDYARDKEIISDDYYNCDVTKKATRSQFAEILAHALLDIALPEINRIGDGAIPDVKTTDRAAAEIYKLYRAGILSGSDARGTFHAQTYISRAEAAAIVSRMAESNNRVKFSLGS